LVEQHQNQESNFEIHNCLLREPLPTIVEISTKSPKTGPAPKGRFATDVLTLASGTMSAQVISILAAPLIARLFSPGAFGIYALFVSVTGLISTIVCFRYESAIVLPDSDEDAANAVGVSVLCAVLTFGLTLILTVIGHKAVVRWLHGPELEPFLWTVPPFVLFWGVLASLKMWNTRKRRFLRLTSVELISTFCSVAIQITAGFLGRVGGGTMILAVVLGLLISTTFLFVQTWRECAQFFRHSLTISRMKQLAQRYHRFPKFSTAGTLLNQLSWQLPTFLLSAFFNPAVVGQYALGNRLMRLPMSLIGSNVGNVFFQRAAEGKHNGALASYVEQTFRYLVRLSLFPCLVLSLVGRDLFVVVFGARWAEAGVFTQILSVWTCFWFISSPLNGIFDVLDQQAFALRFNLINLSTRFLALLIGGLWGGPRLALILFAASGVLMYGYMALTILHRCSVSTAQMLKITARTALGFVPAGAIILAAQWAAVPPLGIVAISAVLLLLYYANLLRVDPLARDLYKKTIRKLRPVQPAAA
jgi:O-antigen/teichoic acid export membrane protein